MNIFRIVLPLASALFFIGKGSTYLLANPPHKEQNSIHVTEFGEEIGRSVSNGFFFVDGVYVEAPYIIARRGLAIFVNDVMIEQPVTDWPPRNVLVPEPPGYPSGLTAQSDFIDIDDNYKDPFDAPCHKQYRYVHQHFPKDRAYEKMREWFAGLPFVSSVKTNRDINTLLVTTLAGSKREYGVGVSGEAYGVVKPLTKDIVIRDLESVRARYEKRLAEGDCFFIFSSGGELSLGTQQTRQILPDIVDTLRGTDQPDAKVNKLKSLGLLPPSWTSNGHQIVNGFHTSLQLEERVQRLRNEQGGKHTDHLSFDEEKTLRTRSQVSPGSDREK